MLDKSLADRYARALYDEAEGQNVLPAVMENMAAFVSAVFSDELLRKFFCHPMIASAEKKNALDGLTGKPEIPQYRTFLEILIDSKRMNYLPLIHERLTHMYNQSRNLLVARAVTAVALPKNMLDRLKDEISRVSGKQIELINRIDPDVIGGISIALDDMVIDATTAHRLRELHNTING